jgi:hypothetical protein
MPLPTDPDTPTVMNHKMQGRDDVYPREPLELSGALDAFRFEETTPTIGREFLDVDIVKDVLESKDADALIRDLAITSKYGISREENLHFTDDDSLKTWRRLLPLTRQVDECSPEGID